MREYKPEEYRALCERHFARVDLLGLFHARKLRAHQFAIERLGWDRVHAALRITKPFYDRFTPGDLACATSRCGAAAWSARWTCSPCCGREPRQHRPAHPHALRRGLRHVAVRRGVAVGGDRDVSYLPLLDVLDATRARSR